MVTLYDRIALLNCTPFPACSCKRHDVLCGSALHPAALHDITAVTTSFEGAEDQAFLQAVSAFSHACSDEQLLLSASLLLLWGASMQSQICVPVQAHYDHTFSVGDVVLNLGRTLGHPGEGGNAAVPLHSVVGEVMRTAGGEVRVHWVDGTESSLPPDQVGLQTL